MKLGRNQLIRFITNNFVDYEDLRSTLALYQGKGRLFQIGRKNKVIRDNLIQLLSLSGEINLGLLDIFNTKYSYDENLYEYLESEYHTGDKLKADLINFNLYDYIDDQQKYIIFKNNINRIIEYYNENFSKDYGPITDDELTEPIKTADESLQDINFENDTQRIIGEDDANASEVSHEITSYSFNMNRKLFSSIKQSCITKSQRIAFNQLVKSFSYNYAINNLYFEEFIGSLIKNNGDIRSMKQVIDFANEVIENRNINDNPSLSKYATELIKLSNDFNRRPEFNIVDKITEDEVIDHAVYLDKAMRGYLPWEDIKSVFIFNLDFQSHILTMWVCDKTAEDILEINNRIKKVYSDVVVSSKVQKYQSPFTKKSYDCHEIKIDVFSLI